MVLGFGGYKWKGSYLQEGVLAFDLETVRLIRNVRSVYSTKYLDYLDGVMSIYPSTSPVYGMASELYEGVQLAIRLIGKVLAEGGSRATKAELSKMFSITKDIAKQMKMLQKALGTEPQFEKEIASLEEDLIPAKVLAKNQKLIAERLKNIPKSPSLAKGFLRATLGGVGGLVGGMAAGIGKKFAYDVLGYSGAALLTGLFRAPMQFAKIFKGSVLGRNQRRRETGLQEFLSTGRTGTGAMRGLGEPSEGGGIFPEEGGLGPFRIRSRRQKEEATEPLFYFFNKRAFRAKWTKELLQAVKGGGLGGGGGGLGGGGGGLGGGGEGTTIIPTFIPGTKGPFGKLLWKAVGVAISIFTGKLLTDAISETFPSDAPGIRGDTGKFLEEHPDVKTGIGVGGAVATYVALKLAVKKFLLKVGSETIGQVPKIASFAEKPGFWSKLFKGGKFAAKKGLGFWVTAFLTGEEIGSGMYNWLADDMPKRHQKGFFAGLVELYQLSQEVSREPHGWRWKQRLSDLSHAGVLPQGDDSVSRLFEDASKKPFTPYLARMAEDMEYSKLVNAPYSTEQGALLKNIDANIAELVWFNKNRSVITSGEPNFQDPDTSELTTFFNYNGD